MVSNSYIKRYGRTEWPFYLLFSLSFLIGLLFSLPTNLHAEGEGWTGDSVLDETGLSSPAELDALREEIKGFPVPVKVLIKSVGENQDLTQMGKDLFSQYKLGDDELFILASAEGTGISVVAGKELAQRGLTPETIRQKLEGFYLPQAKQGAKITGILFLLRELKGNIKAAPPPPKTVEKPSPPPFPWTRLILFLLTALLITLLLFFAYRRWQNRLNQEYRSLVEQKETIKKRLVELRVPDQLRIYDEESRLRYESLKKVHDDYKTRLIPLLEEELGEAEERLSRHRLFAVREILRYVRQTLQEMKTVLDQFHQEQVGLFRKETELPKKVKQAERYLVSLHQSVGDLSSRFGVNLSLLKDRLLVMENYLSRLKGEMNQEQILIQREELDRLLNEMEELTARLKKSEAWVEEMEEHLPARIKQMEHEIKDLHLNVSKENHDQLIAIVKESKELWNTLISLWDEGDLIVLEERINQIKGLLNRGESILSMEREARAQIVTLLTQYEELFAKLEEGYHEDIHLLEKLHRKYQLDQDPILDEEKSLLQRLESLKETYQGILSLMEEEAYTIAFTEAKRLGEEVKEAEEKLLSFHHRVTRLSLEEGVYRQEIARQKNRLLLLRQQLDRSLLPGRQADLYRLIEEGKDAILSVEVLFDQIPVHLHKISQRLEEAKEMISATERMILSTIENAKETEEIIRQLNIFRYREPEIGKLLMMAENSFRDHNFSEAVESARKAKQLVEKMRA